MGVRTSQVPVKGWAAGSHLACFRVIHVTSRKTIWGVRISYLNHRERRLERSVDTVFSFWPTGPPHLIVGFSDCWRAPGWCS